jgi:hypothetical protein
MAGRGHRPGLSTSDDGDTFTMRQVSLQVANTKAGRDKYGQDSTRQIHILTTRTDLTSGEVIYRMGSRCLVPGLMETIKPRRIIHGRTTEVSGRVA